MTVAFRAEAAPFLKLNSNLVCEFLHTIAVSECSAQKE